MLLFLSPAPCEDVCSLKELVVSCQGTNSGDNWAPTVVVLTLADESSLGSCSMCAHLTETIGNRKCRPPPAPPPGARYGP